MMKMMMMKMMMMMMTTGGFSRGKVGVMTTGGFSRGKVGVALMVAKGWIMGVMIITAFSFESPILAPPIVTWIVHLLLALLILLPLSSAGHPSTAPVAARCVGYAGGLDRLQPLALDYAVL